MIITPGKTYRLKPGIFYFVKKYGEEAPLITIENQAQKVFGMGLFEATLKGNWATRLFLERMEKTKHTIPALDEVWYGKIRNLGECVLAEELQEVT